MKLLNKILVLKMLLASAILSQNIVKPENNERLVHQSKKTKDDGGSGNICQSSDHGGSGN